ncbi:Uncharacterized protein DBV15_06053, partial [Temnothorax longispinosus]
MIHAYWMLTEWVNNRVDFIASQFSSKPSILKAIAPGTFSSAHRHAKPRSPSVNSRSKSRHSTSVALSRIGPTFLEPRGKIATYLRSSYSVDQLARIRESMRRAGGLAGHTMPWVSPTFGRRGDPSSHQPRVSSTILLTATINKVKKVVAPCAFQDFHGIATHDDQYEIFSRHLGALGRHARFVLTTIGVSNCENRPGLLRRTVNVGGGLSTRKYNRRLCIGGPGE